MKIWSTVNDHSDFCPHSWNKLLFSFWCSVNTSQIHSFKSFCTVFTMIRSGLPGFVEKEKKIVCHKKNCLFITQIGRTKEKEREQ